MIWEIHRNSKGFCVHILCSCTVRKRKRGKLFIKQLSVTFKFHSSEDTAAPSRVLVIACLEISQGLAMK